MKSIFALMLLVLGCLTCVPAAWMTGELLAGEVLELEVTSSAAGTGGLLSRIAVPPELAALIRKQPAWRLESREHALTLPIQIRENGNASEIAWRSPRFMPPGTKIRFRLITEPVPPEPAYRVSDEAGRIIVSHKRRPLFVYNRETLLPPTGVNLLYARSGHIHPVYTPTGRVISDDFAPDHYHQHGMFYAWVNTQFQQQPVDFWNQAKGQGTVRHAQMLQQTSGPVFAELQFELQHVAFPAQMNEQTVLRERVSILVHRADTVTAWEVFSEQTNVTEVPLILEKYHYGGFGFRGAREWNAPETKSRVEFLTSAGKNRQAGNHTPADWVMLSGPLSASQPPAENETETRAGVVIFGHPGNLRATQMVRLHPDNPYFCFCPVVDEAFTIEPGRVLKSRYLVLTFDGSLPAERIQQLFAEYAQPAEMVLFGGKAVSRQPE
ncbi:MAG: PmoA family protein [Planctomycetaceae bacterium]|nr:PmoA family protein [Planctomycetaceae bacterium]